MESKADVVGLFLLTVGCTLRVSCEYWRTRVMYGSFRFTVNILCKFVLQKSRAVNEPMMVRLSQLAPAGNPR